MRRRWWLVLGSGVALLAAGVALAWQAASQASAVQADLVATRDLLGRAAALDATPPPQRLALIRQADGHARAAAWRLDRWPLRQLGAVPLLGRDVRVARAIAWSTTGVVCGTGAVGVALEPLRTRPPSRARIARAASALLQLGHTLDQGITRVRAARPLLAGRAARGRYLAEAARASQAAATAGDGLRLAATLYGPAGSAHYFLAFQNPAELRGTGGLIGQYGVLESSPQGPRLTTVESYAALDQRTREGVPLPAEVARRYGRFSVNRTWSAVNIPPDLPTVGRIVRALYRQATGARIDGMIAVDPFAVAEILRSSGPITVEGLRLDAGNVAAVTLVEAYVRYAADNQARRAFLEKTARATFAAFQRALRAHPDGLLRALTVAAQGRHLQLYSADPVTEQALLRLGIAGSAAAPRDGDYLMPVAINTGGNKLDAFLHRTVRYHVTLAPDGRARATASITLRNAVPAIGLPRYIVGPYDQRFRARESNLFQMLYVAGGYGFTKATRDGRPVPAEAQAEGAALSVAQKAVIPPGRSVTLAYDLERDGAVRISGGRASYQLMARPQPTVNPDRLEVSVQAPRGWRAVWMPPGARQVGGTVSWAGLLDRTLTFQFIFRPTGQSG